MADDFKIVNTEYRRKRNGIWQYQVKVQYKGHEDRSKEMKRAILYRLKERGKTILSANWVHGLLHLKVNCADGKRLYIFFRV